MCCIFTCFGWCIDLAQRLWTFVMACCISSAVCCALFTASMSGIALGYNYSLAEYIDLKETNVSVFLKRGVFDDEIADDMDWRRAGHQPVAGHLKDDNLVTGASDDQMDDTRRSGMAGKSGRRMDDNIFQSDDQNRFEGSLMKLTAKPLDPGTTTNGPTPDQVMGEIARNYDPGTMDQLKAVQSLINRRKFNLMSTVPGDSIPTAIIDAKQLADFPARPGERPYGDTQLGNRRVMEMQGPHDDSLRKLVPYYDFANKLTWNNAKFPPDKRITAYLEEDITFPPPITPRVGPLRPTRPKPPKKETFPRARTTETALKAGQKFGDELNRFREGFLKDKFDTQSGNSGELMNNMMEDLPPKPEGAEDYEEDVKGIPVRRRRNIKVSEVTKLTGETKTEENHTKTYSNFIDEESKLEDASVSKDLSTVLARVKNFIVTTVPDNFVSPNDPMLNLETSTRKLFVKIMKSTIL